MTQKIVYQTNSQHIFVGVAEADESPLEPGVWLIPGGCVELAPPKVGPGMRARWAQTQWVLEPIPLAVTEADASSAIDVMQTYIGIIQRHMDAKAQEFGYDSLISGISYADEPAVPKFQAEGQALRAWRSQVWAFGYEYLAKVQASEQALPTPDELLAELPAFEMLAPPVEA